MTGELNNNPKYNCFLIDDDPEEFEIFQMALNLLSQTLVARHYFSPAAAVDGWNRASIPPSYIFMDLNIPGIIIRNELRLLLDEFPLPLTEVIVYSFPCSQQAINLITGAENLRCMEKQSTVAGLASEFKKIFCGND